MRPIAASLPVRQVREEPLLALRLRDLPKRSRLLTPAVAVIIPTFNRATLLCRAVDSVLRQTCRDFELVVVDDGSTDGTPALAARYAAEPRFRMLRLDRNRGVSAARNAGAAASGAPWIAFLDSDDEWLPKKLERQLLWTAGNPSFEIAQTQELWIRNGRRVNPPRSQAKSCGDLFAASLERCMITPSSVLMRRTLFERLGGFDPEYPACEDFDLWLRVTCRYPVGLVDEYLLKRYGGHGDQLSKTVPLLDRFRVASAIRLIGETALSPHQRELTAASIAKRAAILAQGCRKRGKFAEYEKYREIIVRYGEREPDRTAAFLCGAADSRARTAG